MLHVVCRLRVKRPTALPSTGLPRHAEEAVPANLDPPKLVISDHDTPAALWRPESIVAPTTACLHNVPSLHTMTGARNWVHCHCHWCTGTPGPGSHALAVSEQCLATSKREIGTTPTPSPRKTTSGNLKRRLTGSDEGDRIVSLMDSNGRTSQPVPGPCLSGGPPPLPRRHFSA